MSYTALGLIEGALRLIGVLAEGESASSQSATDALNTLNDLIDSWSNEGLLNVPVLREVFALGTVGLQETYTWGSGGNLNSARPITVQRALIQLTGSNPPMELPLQVMNLDQYSSVVLKTLASNFPLYCYIDDAYPSKNVSVWPVPTDSTNSLVFYSVKPLVDPANLQTVLSLPPGYLRPLRYGLAIDLAPEYGKSAQESVVVVYEQAKAAIKRANTKPVYLSMDSGLTGKPSAYNWRTDGYDR